MGFANEAKRLGILSKPFFLTPLDCVTLPECHIFRQLRALLSERPIGYIKTESDVYKANFLEAVSGGLYPVAYIGLSPVRRYRTETTHKIIVMIEV